ncbi:hypothetical protein KIN20_022319 [Parelaphostrongylus tenuis]|uniref:Uncharacterized protein n=1 Tax=Parelaphostrongylus tenuis TaxID=148309 RepID=A0AAD5MQG0_PARTN|nr:hypothetical protein KIN20_022319 [Parelaphostrongylus tenuis]
MRFIFRWRKLSAVINHITDSLSVTSLSDQGEKMRTNIGMENLDYEKEMRMWSGLAGNTPAARLFPEKFNFPEETTPPLDMLVTHWHMRRSTINSRTEDRVYLTNP